MYGVPVPFIFYVCVAGGMLKFDRGIISTRTKGYWDFRISDLEKTLMELIFNPCDEFQWGPKGPLSEIHSPRRHVAAPGIFPNLLSSFQKLKREWDAESNGKLQHLYIPNKIATLVPELAEEDLALDKTAT